MKTKARKVLFVDRPLHSLMVWEANELIKSLSYFFWRL